MAAGTTWSIGLAEPFADCTPAAAMESTAEDPLDGAEGPGQCARCDAHRALGTGQAAGDRSSRLATARRASAVIRNFSAGLPLSNPQLLECFRVRNTRYNAADLPAGKPIAGPVGGSLVAWSGEYPGKWLTHCRWRRR
eukprot:SAG31_NODE_2728_length_5180_cov_2.415469_5_plen_138_part_00